MDRRAFLRSSLKTAAAVSAAGSGLILQGCTKAKDFDLVVAGGTVYDGAGGAPVRADVGISGGAIREIGRIRRSRAAAVAEARGLAVSPGFIDVHDHTDMSLLVNPKAESAVRQGVTTLVSGQCGGSPFPLSDEAVRPDAGVARQGVRARGRLEVTSAASSAGSSGPAWP